MGKVKKLDKVYVIVPAGDVLVESALKIAEARAKEECMISGSPYQIFEVTKAWYVEIPEEPEPEIVEDDLESVLG